MRRRWRAGQLPGAYRDHTGQVRVPVAAVAAITTKPRAPVGLSQGYVADALWVLRRILAFARANGLFPPGFDPTEGLDAPTRRPGRRPHTRPEAASPGRSPWPSAPASPPTSTRCTSSAFWLQRIMGLRISEAFGIPVGDVVDLGDTGLLAVQGQGGRTFNVRDDHGQIVAVPYKPTMKTAAGSRVLVVPPKLMELLRVGHRRLPHRPRHRRDRHHRPARARPPDAQPLRPARLPPRLRGSRHRRTLSSDHLGFRVSSHLLRKSCATDLAWTAGIEDAVRRRFMGHRAGDDVFGRIYTLDHPDVAPLAKVAEILDHNIAITIGSLMTPTVRRVHWGTANPTLVRADHIDATLAAAGWLVEPGNADDPLCDAQRVAAELDIYPTTARRWMTDGTIPTVAVPDATGVPRRHARLSDVWQLRDRLAGQILLPDLAEDLGLRYHEAYNMLRRLGLEAEQHPGNHEYQLTHEAAEALRVEHQRIQALHRRSMKLAAAARAAQGGAKHRRAHVPHRSAGRRPRDRLQRRYASSPAPRFSSAGSTGSPRPARGAGRSRRYRSPRSPASPARAPERSWTSSGPASLSRSQAGEPAQLTATSLRAWMAAREPGDVAAGSISCPAAIMPLRVIGEPAHDAPEPSLKRPDRVG